jgi:hypothetical protein
MHLIVREAPVVVEREPRAVFLDRNWTAVQAGKRFAIIGV